jgi:hypothetical protein
MEVQKTLNNQSNPEHKEQCCTQPLAAHNLATWQAEIRRITVQDQPLQIVHETPISKKLEQKGLES